MMDEWVNEAEKNANGEKPKRRWTACIDWCEDRIVDMLCEPSLLFLPVALLVTLLCTMFLVDGNRDVKAVLGNAPAHARAYLSELGRVPDGEIHCRLESGVFLYIGILCDAFVGGTPTTLRCRVDSCQLETR